jgi:serine O-acetyltransferase
MWSLIEAYRKYDPATSSRLEILLLYPGVKAVLIHRMANALYRWGVPFLPRFLTETGRFLTGIDIHPGATIGKNVIIDHGMGVVIGETAVVGDGVMLYQGVTLGGTDFKRVKRHPTLEDGVVVGAGAKVLGNILIGRGTRIGANSVVVDSVPADCTVVGIPAKVVNRHGVKPGEELSHELIKSENKG